MAPKPGPPKAQALRDLIAWLRTLLPHGKVVLAKAPAKHPAKAPAKVPPRAPVKVEAAVPSAAKPLFGIDYAWGNPNIGAMRAAGVQFVCRYLAEPGNTKSLRKLELAALRRVGLPVVTVWETTAGRATAGRAAGKADAMAAQLQLHQLGAPSSAVVFFAVDFDLQAETVGDYFRGAADALGLARVGVYGGYPAVKRLFDAHLVRWGWQTYAWSGGKWDTRAKLQQYSNDHVLAGVSCDFNHAIAPSFGQWR